MRITCKPWKFCQAKFLARKWSEPFAIKLPALLHRVLHHFDIPFVLRIEPNSNAVARLLNKRSATNVEESHWMFCLPRDRLAIAINFLVNRHATRIQLPCRRTRHAHRDIASPSRTKRRIVDTLPRIRVRVFRIGLVSIVDSDAFNITNIGHNTRRKTCQHNTAWQNKFSSTSAVLGPTFRKESIPRKSNGDGLVLCERLIKRKDPQASTIFYRWRSGIWIIFLWLNRNTIEHPLEILKVCAGRERNLRDRFLLLIREHIRSLDLQAASLWEDGNIGIERIDLWNSDVTEGQLIALPVITSHAFHHGSLVSISCINPNPTAGNKPNDQERRPAQNFFPDTRRLHRINGALYIANAPWIKRDCSQYANACRIENEESIGDN